jgi:hypothetical protein
MGRLSVFAMAGFGTLRYVYVEGGQFFKQVLIVGCRKE